MKVLVTGATGFLGAHVARRLCERGDRVRVTYRDPDRLKRLGGLDVEPVKADVLDAGAMRRALRGCDVLYHAAGYVGAKPAKVVWQVNALSPRVAVEAAAKADVGRVVLTSSVAAVGPARSDGEPVDEDAPYRAGRLALTYGDAKHEGEVEALAASARTGTDVVIVNPGYVLGVPVDRTQPGETSTRIIGNYLRGRLPALVDGGVSIVDVGDAAHGHLLAADKGRPGERYLLGGHNLGWIELIDRVSAISGVGYPLIVIPRETAAALRAPRELGLPVPYPIDPEGLVLMAQRFWVSSAKAARELGYRFGSLESTLRATIEWYREMIDNGTFEGGGNSGLSLFAAGLRAGERAGLLRVLRAAEGRLGRRLVAGG